MSNKIQITRYTLATRWTVSANREAWEAAYKLVRGIYQRRLLSGCDNLSGSSLAGKARRYSGRYRRSAQNLLDRLTHAGIAWCELRGPHNRRVLCIGAERDDVEIVA